MWVAELAPLARKHTTDVWLARFAECFAAIGDRLAAGSVAHNGLPRCTGEEVALRLTIDQARDFLADGVILVPPNFGDV